MVQIVSKQLDYTSEVTGNVITTTFKIRADKDELPVASGGYEDAPTNVCGGTANQFKMRALVVYYTDGSTIRYPISTRDAVRQTVVALADADDVACVDYEGEQWNVVNGFGNADSDGFNPQPVNGKYDYLTGTYQYSSDLFENPQTTQLRIEQNTGQLSEYATSCVGAIDENPVCSTTPQGLRTRRVIMIDKNTGQGTSVRRHAPVADPADIRSCLDGAPSICVGYQGERIKNAHLLV